MATEADARKAAIARETQYHLSRFRSRVEESSDLHRSTVAARDETRPDGKPRIHKDGMDADEKARSVDRAAAEIRNAMGGA